MHNFKNFKGKGPAAGARGGMRISATATAARGATLLQSKPSLNIGRGGTPSGRLLTTGTSRQQDHLRTDLFGRPIVRLPAFNRQCEPAAALPLTADDTPTSNEVVETSAASPPPEALAQDQSLEPAAALASSSPASLVQDSNLTAPLVALDSGSQPPSPQTPAAAEVAAPADVEYFPIEETGNNSPLSPERLEQPVLARFLLPDSLAGFVIGNEGERVVSYKERSGAKVWISGPESSIKGAGMRMLCVSGKLEQVAEATFMVLTDLTSDEAPGKRKAYFISKDGKLVKARFLAPAWLSGTILGRNASHVKAICAETGGFVRLSPSAAEEEQDRLVELAGSSVGVVVRVVEEILKLFLRNPKYKAVYIAPGVSVKALDKRKEWYKETHRIMKAESKDKWLAKQPAVQGTATAEAAVTTAL